jgi:hypothetical protein
MVTFSADGTKLVKNDKGELKMSEFFLVIGIL